jgi:MYXO-CTERM domain-containing protein
VTRVKRIAGALFILCLTPTPALAQTLEDPDALSAEVDRDYMQVQASDCATACQALASMRRATERLCVLDPGDRCARARTKLDDATTRVHASCPSCVVGPGTPQATPSAAPAPEAPSNAELAQPTEEYVAVSHKGGGCGGCATSPAAGGNAALAGLGALALVVMRRRRLGRFPRGKRRPRAG